MTRIRKAARIMADDGGFSTPAMAVALIVALSLVFSTAQVYRVHAASAGIQDVADAAALAAENEVAEFMIVVRVCDAVVLSLSLTGIVAMGLGVAALCTPVTAVASERLISIGTNVLQARDRFSERASDGLDALQKALPFLAAANAASVAAANNGGAAGSEYLAVAFLVPGEGSSIAIAEDEAADGLTGEIEAQRDALAEAAQEAEDAAAEAAEAKQRAFERDCGDAPSYCMYERAATLAGLSGSDNPLYHSVDAWSFSVALERAQAYYPRRLAIEAPEGDSVEEQARSALRARFYRYAADEVAQGYVRDDGESFEAYFPRLPKNTSEMRETSLYTEAVYPVTEGEGGPVMHAWDGCPEAGGATARGSIADMEEAGYATCSSCGFTAASLGRVASASTSIENGFEYHYDAVAREAELYEQARAKLEPSAREVRERAGGLIEQCQEAARGAASVRIDARPPGSYGAVALVVDLGETPASTGFESSFVTTGATLGARAAVSGATLLEDPSGEGASVITSLLDGVADQGGVATGVAGVILDAWSSLLGAYASGQSALEGAVEAAANAVSFGSESGLGTWAAEAFSDAMAAVGLEPADLDAVKPVLVNTSYVVEADAGGSFSARFIVVKDAALSLPGSTSNVFASAVSDIERAALDDLSVLEGGIEIATIEPLGEGGPSIPVTIALPSAVTSAATGIVEQAVGALRSLVAGAAEVLPWE